MRLQVRDSTDNDTSPLRCCRSCGESRLSLVFKTAPLPLANALSELPGSASIQRRIPLELVLCDVCGLLQLNREFPPELIFNPRYPYFSSYSPHYLDHAEKFAVDQIRRKSLDSGNFVVEIASNDGYLLKNFARSGVRVLGIDPATEQAQSARRHGVETISEFFSRHLAGRIVREYGHADLVVANNVLAHVPDPLEVLLGAAELIHDRGTVSIEVPYVVNLLKNSAFDTIYHEHQCYFSLHVLNRLMAAAGLRINEVELLEIHGGSIRLLCSKSGAVSAALETLLKAEEAQQLQRPGPYYALSRDVGRVSRDLRSLLDSLRQGQTRIAGYGAAAKGATLIHLAGIAEDLDYVVDRNPHKQGLFMPGSDIRIRGPEKLVSSRPDYILLLAWNFADEIMSSLPEFAGRFIVPLPEPKLV